MSRAGRRSRRAAKPRGPDPFTPDSLSKVRHEIRTPLVAMQHALSLLHDEVAGPLSEEQRRFVSLAIRNLERLSGLLNDLLDPPPPRQP